MSFGRRLRLFFIGIVAIPMVVLAVLVIVVSRDSQDGKADARLASGLDTARALYDEALADAPAQARDIAKGIGPDLANANAAALTAAANGARTNSDVIGVRILDVDGNELASSGPADAIAIGQSVVGSSGNGQPLGSVQVAMLDRDDFLDRVSALTGRDAALADDSGLLASTSDLDASSLPPGADADDVDLPGGDSGRGAALALDGATPGARLVLVTPTDNGIFSSEPLIAVVLAVFFAVAFFLIVMLLRDLQRRVATMLTAARRIGEGDFDTKVPVEGDDEMAGLAREMNRMSDKLSEQVQMLSLQRKELDESIHRIGEAFASGLDQQAMLEIVADTAVSACGAEAGRVGLRDRGRTIVTRDAPNALAPVLRAAGEQVWDEDGEGVAADGERHAIAEAMVGRRGAGDILCAIAIARTGKPFTEDERGVLRYLIGQTIASAENIDLHERISEQAFTDELTRIPNHRHFTQWIDQEVARIGRYGGELSLVLLDIDDFKLINDTHGHLQGDRVLERLGGLLADQVRGVDLAARYGGEEFVLALPDTPREGAVQVAERLRKAVNATEVDGLDGGAPIKITASLGVATLPVDATDQTTLIAAADAALYDAKRSGKNQVVAAAYEAPAPAQGNGPERRRQ